MSETTDAKAGWIRAALERFETPLTRYAFRITGDLERVRDVVQDCFLSLCGESPARYRRPPRTVALQGLPQSGARRPKEGSSFPAARRRLGSDGELLLLPRPHWQHLRTSSVVELPFAALRLRADPAKRFKKVETATARDRQGQQYCRDGHSALVQPLVISPPSLFFLTRFQQ